MRILYATRNAILRMSNNLRLISSTLYARHQKGRVSNPPLSTYFRHNRRSPCPGSDAISKPLFSEEIAPVRPRYVVSSMGLRGRGAIWLSVSA